LRGADDCGRLLITRESDALVIVRRTPDRAAPTVSRRDASHV
jgi:hypothetical protein